MKIKRDKLHEEFDRDLYWTIIIFFSDDESQKTRIFICSSQEYLDDYYKIAADKNLSQQNIEDWLNKVIEKWSTLGEEIFNQDSHYDVYANTEEGEANGLDFLLKRVK